MRASALCVEAYIVSALNHHCIAKIQCKYVESFNASRMISLYNVSRLIEASLYADYRIYMKYIVRIMLCVRQHCV